MSGILEDSSAIAQTISNIGQKLTIGKFLKWAIILVIFAAIIYPLYDKLVPTSFYNKIDNKLSIIEKVIKLDSSDSTIKSETKQRLIEIIKNIDPPKTDYLDIIKSFNFNFDINYIYKFLSAFVIPILLLFSINKNDEETSKRDTSMGSIFIGIIFGFIALLIPVFYSIWINVLIINLIMFVLLFLASKFIK